jgi:hypothetical protein
VEELPYQRAPRTAPHEREPPREPQSPRAASPQNVLAATAFTPVAEPNFAEMIEAVLRRRRKPGGQSRSRPDTELRMRPTSSATSETQTEAASRN